MSDTPAGLLGIREDLLAVLARRALTEDAARPDAVAKLHRRGGRTAREHIASTSSSWCVEIRIALVAAMRAMRARMAIFWFGSRPSVGSSRISTGGSWTIARARATRRR